MDASEVLKEAKIAIVELEDGLKEEVEEAIAQLGGSSVDIDDASCTHVLVDQLTRFDHVCVKAMGAGKHVVTIDWLHDCLEEGALLEPLKPTHIPLGGTEGIPGANELNISLTGFRSKERQYIERLVNLMGARFMKALATKVTTHLVIYEFQGDKYEMAKKHGIKMVNHKWVEDCIREWTLLPESDYQKCGAEIESEELGVKSSFKKLGDERMRKEPLKDKTNLPEASKIGSPLKSRSFPSVNEVKQEREEKEEERKEKEDKMRRKEEEKEEKEENEENQEQGENEGKIKKTLNFQGEETEEVLKLCDNVDMDTSTELDEELNVFADLDKGDEENAQLKNCTFELKSCDAQRGTEEGNEEFLSAKSFPSGPCENSQEEFTIIRNNAQEREKESSELHESDYFLSDKNESLPLKFPIELSLRDWQEVKSQGGASLVIPEAPNLNEGLETEKDNLEPLETENLAVLGAKPDLVKSSEFESQDLGAKSPHLEIKETKKKSSSTRKSTKRTVNKKKIDKKTEEVLASIGKQVVLSGFRGLDLAKEEDLEGERKEENKDEKSEDSENEEEVKEKELGEIQRENEAEISLLESSKGNKEEEVKRNLIFELENEPQLESTGTESEKDKVLSSAGKEASLNEGEEEENPPKIDKKFDEIENLENDMGSNSALGNEEEVEILGEINAKFEGDNEIQVRREGGKFEGKNEVEVRREEGTMEGKNGGGIKYFALGGWSGEKEIHRRMIRKLGGKLSGENHQWKSTATHVVLQFLKRTEKFICAAASGRWILKSSYVEESFGNGKFLEEEKYEWYGKGFTEDGSISMEACRRWRLQFEKSGKRAFEGLRVLIYGQHFVPPTETLKRAFKAGGGTVVASEPPYSKQILSKKIDFAIVTADKKEDDEWVSKFLEKKIPCVTAEFFIEYISKPGQELSHNVLFHCHGPAMEALERLQKLTSGEEKRKSQDSVDQIKDGNKFDNKRLKTGPKNRALWGVEGRKSSEINEILESKADSLEKSTDLENTQESQDLGGGRKTARLAKKLKNEKKGEISSSFTEGVKCEGCGAENGDLILCGRGTSEGCGRKWHKECLHPPLKSKPRGRNWYCPDCQAKRKKPKLGK